MIEVMMLRGHAWPASGSPAGYGQVAESLNSAIPGAVPAGIVSTPPVSINRPCVSVLRLNCWLNRVSLVYRVSVSVIGTWGRLAPDWTGLAEVVAVKLLTTHSRFPFESVNPTAVRQVVPPSAVPATSEANCG